jgi:3-oxoadipate enol-lactonase
MIATMTLPHDDVGSGPAVLLLHAGVADRRMWRVQSAACAASGMRAVAPDLRGFGDSPEPAEPFSHLDDLVALLDDLSIESADVVGASYGGYLAQELAVRHPRRVRSLVLLCPATVLLEPDATLTAFGEEETRLLDAGELDAAVELNLRTWVGPGADDGARSLVRQMQRRAFDLQVGQPETERDDGESDPHDIHVRTLVVTGRHDLAAFQDAARRLADVLEDGRLAMLDWAGHLPSLERPEDTAALVVDTLQERSLDGGSR